MRRATRTERDSLGEKAVPDSAYYGIQTLRAVENFAISGLRVHPAMIDAIALIKQAAAETNMALGELDPRIGQAIVKACKEIAQGQWHEQFVVDVFQAGAGTSFNMNANEVIANRSIEMLGGKRGDYSLVHPNDHANMAQSTNDVVPTTVRLASLALISRLTLEVEMLAKALAAKADEFRDVVKSGRTHLQDAVPITLGQEFGAYAAAVHRALKRFRHAVESLEEIGLGGTAVGTGINTHPRYRAAVTRRLG
ncbi:MAG: lyase family protein, partial [Chloroflexota bacterium]|nr:lyase family protein [Chloroflexota bacterium]